MSVYKHTQVGYSILIPVLMVIIGLFLLSTYYMSSYQWISYLVILILILALIIFITLTVEVKNNRVRLSFGIGLIRREFSLDQVKSVRTVKYPWWYGWGVRIIPHGRLYNVSGTRAVELEMDNDQIIMIGSDEADILYAKINDLLKT